MNLLNYQKVIECFEWPWCLHVYFGLALRDDRGGLEDSIFTSNVLDRIQNYRIGDAAETLI